MGVFADRLVGRLDRAWQWPLPDDRDVWARIDLWIALRESDRDYLAKHVGWDRKGRGREYRIDPLAPRIPEAFASLIFGRAPDLEAAAEGDQPQLDELAQENQLGAELKRGEITCSSEGQVWWRIYVDPDVADRPLVEWHSRVGVVPLWVGKKLKACAFVTRLDQVTASDTVAWRWFEIHDAEHVRNVLYRGDGSALGRRVDLSQHPETEFLDPDPWAHGMGRMLAGRIVNRFGSDFREGVSDYDGIDDYLLMLNEAAAVGHENMRLAGKKRAVVPPEALDESGSVPDDQEYLVAGAAGTDPLGEEGKGSAASMYKVLEYTWNATEHIAWTNHLAATALGRIGITPQFLGMPSGDGGDGLAVTGTALRLRLLPDTIAGEDRAQDWDAQLPVIIELLQRLDAQPPDHQGRGGFGHPWRQPATPPAINRGSSLPEDPVEETSRHTQAVAGEIESRQTAIEEMHPEWDQARVDEEMRRIREEHKTFSGGGLGSLLRDVQNNGRSNGTPPVMPGAGSDGEPGPPAGDAGAAVGAA